MLRANDDRYEYLVLSDSAIVLDIAAEPLVIADRSVEHVAKDEVVRAYSMSIDDEEHSQRHHAVIAAQQRVRNTPSGYWVAQADPGAAKHAQCGSVVKHEVRGALVLSDGAARAVVDFGQLSWRELLDLAQSDGPAVVIGRTRELERQDPSGVRWPRYKVSDDASVIVCTS
jgi:hypothetical protein